MLSQQLQYVLIPLQGNALQSVEEHLAGHHGNDYGVPPSDINGPCAIAGMFGCAPAFSDDDYNREGLVHDGPPVVFSRKQQFN